MTVFRPGLRAAASPIDNLGLVTDEPIGAGETVMTWGGRLYRRRDLVNGGVPAGSSYSFIDEDLLMAGADDDLDYFVNHSCDPNLWMQDDITVVARRDIAAGEELTGDYALWEGDTTYVLDPCRCGSGACRGRVTGDDWQLDVLQRRYAGHFLPYLQRRIDALHARSS